MELAILICVIAMALTNAAALYFVYLTIKPKADKPAEVFETPDEPTDEEKKKQEETKKLWDEGVNGLLSFQPKVGGSK